MSLKHNAAVIAASLLTTGTLAFSVGGFAPTAADVFGRDAFAVEGASMQGVPGSADGPLTAWAQDAQKSAALEEAAITSIADARRTVAQLQEEQAKALAEKDAALQRRDAGIASLQGREKALQKQQEKTQIDLANSRNRLTWAQVEAQKEGRRADAERLQAAKENAAAKEAQAQVASLKLQLAQKELELLEAQGAATTTAPAGDGALPEGGTPAKNKALAQQMMQQRGYSAKEIQCVNRIWDQESGFKHTAENASSGAYGIPQALPAKKMASAGADWKTNPATQIKWGLDYIEERHGGACAAKEFKFDQGHGWY